MVDHKTKFWQELEKVREQKGPNMRFLSQSNSKQKFVHCWACVISIPKLKTRRSWRRSMFAARWSCLGKFKTSRFTCAQNEIAATVVAMRATNVKIWKRNVTKRFGVDVAFQSPMIGIVWTYNFKRQNFVILYNTGQKTTAPYHTGQYLLPRIKQGKNSCPVLYWAARIKRGKICCPV